VNDTLLTESNFHLLDPSNTVTLKWVDCKDINMFVRKTRTKLIENYKHFMSADEEKLVNNFMTNVKSLNDKESFNRFRNMLKVFEAR